MKKFMLTIGDAVDREKDLVAIIHREEVPTGAELRDFAIFNLRPDQETERLIENAEVDRYEHGVALVINEGPNGECAPNGGPWLVAGVEMVEP